MFGFEFPASVGRSVELLNKIAGSTFRNGDKYLIFSQFYFSDAFLIMSLNEEKSAKDRAGEGLRA